MSPSASCPKTTYTVVARSGVPAKYRHIGEFESLYSAGDTAKALCGAIDCETIEIHVRRPRPKPAEAATSEE